MIKRNVAPIISVIIIIASMYLIYNKLHIKKQQTNTGGAYTAKDGLNRERELKKLELQSEKTRLGRLVLQDKDNNDIRLSDIIHGKRLVYAFSPGSCFACVETDIGHIKKLSRITGKNKILVITNYDNFRYYKIFINQMKLGINCYNSKTGLGLEIENDRNNIPFYFVIGDKKVVGFVHARKENDSAGDAYFTKVITYLKNGQKQ